MILREDGYMTGTSEAGQTVQTMNCSAIRISVGGLEVVEVYQLGDGRMEVQWVPVDRSIDEELEYLAQKVNLQVSRTKSQAASKEDLIHYLFDRENKWYGIRCPKEVWRLFMKSKDISNDLVDAFIKEWTESPIKRLMDKELVEEVRSTRPWTGLE
jgi:hypothetical protein